MAQYIIQKFQFEMSHPVSNSTRSPVYKKRSKSVTSPDFEFCPFCVQSFLIFKEEMWIVVSL